MIFHMESIIKPQNDNSTLLIFEAYYNPVGIFNKLLNTLLLRRIMKKRSLLVMLPTVKSEQPLPPDQKTTAAIKDLLREMEFPTGKPIPPLPAIAAKISGKAIQCEPNDAHWKSVLLNFDLTQNNACSFTINLDQNINRTPMNPPVPVGLDGRYRVGDQEDENLGYDGEKIGITAFKGAWVSDNTFIINEQELRRVERFDFKFTFNQNEVAIDIISSVLGHLLTIQGDY